MMAAETRILFSRICERKIRNFLLPRRANRFILRPARAAKGDASRSSRNVGAGCDGRCGVRRACSPDETSAAYGEVVWSWRRDRGVYPVLPVRASATVTTNAAHRGEHEVSRKAIAWGKPGCLGCTCSPCPCASARGMPVCSSARDLRAQSAPGFPCALSSEEGQRDCKTRAKSCRGNEDACLSTSLRAKRRPVYACCASYARLGVHRSSESEGGSNPASSPWRMKAGLLPLCSQ